MENTQAITIEATINAPIDKVWKMWNTPEDIMGWAFASDDWEAPFAENDLRIGGKFVTTMAAKDKSASFDFSGIYSNVKENEIIEYSMEDGRKVSIKFKNLGESTKVIETFDPEKQNPAEMQQAGWQSILDNFKKYVEGKK